MMITSVTSKVELEDALADNWRRLVVIYFHSACDDRCSAAGEAYEGLSAKHRDVAFLKVEVNRCKDALNALSTGCEITELPTFLFFKEERTVDKYCGTCPEELERKIKENVYNSYSSYYNINERCAASNDCSPCIVNDLGH